MGSAPLISVIIVNRNTKGLLKNCLESLPAGFSTVPYEIWVIDNGSKDGSVDMLVNDYPHINLIQNSHNLGFARANNQALRRISTPFALLLNSDTLLTNNSIVHLYQFLKNYPQAALVGPKLINRDGTLQPSTYPLPQFWKDLLLSFKIYKLLPAKLKSRFFLGSFWDHSEKRMVGRITGACILLRMEDVKPIDFFDESFFFYGEVHDLCWTLWKLSRHIWFNPQSVVTHLGGQTSKKMWNYRDQRRRMWRETERLLRKHQPLRVVRITIFLNYIKFLIPLLLKRIMSVSDDESVNYQLLKVDFSWHKNRLKEMLWYKIRHIFYRYYNTSFYDKRFCRSFSKTFNCKNIFALNFTSETNRLRTELTDKWNSIALRHRSGFMDFSCSELLYHIIRWFKPHVVVETGVANGISSTFILAAMDANKMGHLYSIDWQADQESSFVPKGKDIGWMIPDQLRKRWHLEIGKTEDKLQSLLEGVGRLDIFLHDSDHTYDTMMYEYTTAWPYLVEHGLLLSDDVIMSTAFIEFTEDTNTVSIIYKGRLGITQKLEE